MLSTLAAANTAQATLFDPIVKIFARPDALAHPKELLDALQAMSVVWAVVFIIAGIVCMLNGYRFYKSVTVILALLVGMFAGYALSARLQAPAYIVAGCLGLLMAVLCFPLMKYAVAVLGGLTGAFLGANLWTAIVHVVYKNDPGALANAAKFNGIGALIGLLVCGMLAFILFKMAVVLFTSVSGSTVAVLGVLALLLQIPGMHESIFNSISKYPVVVPMLVFVPTIIGLILQANQKNAPGVAGKIGGEKKPAAAA